MTLFLVIFISEYNIYRERIYADCIHIHCIYMCIYSGPSCISPSEPIPPKGVGRTKPSKFEHDIWTTCPSLKRQRTRNKYQSLFGMGFPFKGYGMAI